MIKLVDSCSSSQAHYQFNDKLSEELLFDRQSNFFQVRSRRLNDFPLIHLFSCHTSSTTNCSLILCLQTIFLFILHRSRCSLTLTKVWSPRSPGTPREPGRTKSAGSVLCFSLSVFYELFFQIGGNMGLFTGFSVISGIEIIYWIWFKVLLL